MRNAFSHAALALLALSLLPPRTASAQQQGASTGMSSSSAGSGYFQQRVDYILHAQLAPARQTVAVDGQFTYHNASPDALDSIPVQLWANAFTTRETPFATQVRRLANPLFAFAPDAALGGVDSLWFRSARLARVRVANPELHWLVLEPALAPGDSLTVAFEYTLRVPFTFSRMGHAGETYQITQWYPKPAVYDQAGWHPLPYLDQGEFFSEFGTYDVTVQVPTNGIVAATGALDNPAGIAAREARIAASRADTATIDSLHYGDGTTAFHFTAERVHDFAWFAAPSFRVSVDSAALRDGRTIPAYAYSSAADAPRWRNAAGYVARAVAFADSAVGHYPYPQVSAVRASLAAGGGMEYPMITVIGLTTDEIDLDDVLAHEVFHNWFYGLLASNERVHPWMDEGLTSYLEARYMARYHPDHRPLDAVVPEFLSRGTAYGPGAALHALLAGARRAPAPDTHSDSLSQIGYGYATYLQPQHLFQYAEAAVGLDSFGRRLRVYYDAWAFRHPGPRDLQASLGGEEVAWLFDDFLLDDRIPDYAVRAVERSGQNVAVTVVNRAGVASPLSLGYRTERKGSWRGLTWYPGFTGERTLVLPASDSARAIGLDPLLMTPELRRNDNYARVDSRGPARGAPAVNFLTHLGHPDRADINLLPLLAYTSTDGLMLGLGGHNHVITGNRFRYELLPLVATGSGALNGFAGLSYSFYAEDRWWRELELSARGRSFRYNDNASYDYQDRFARLTLGADLLLAAAPGLPHDHRLRARAHGAALRYAIGIDVAEGRFDEVTRGYTVFELGYGYRRRDPITPAALSLDLQAGSGFSRASATYTLGLRYRAEPSFLRLRAFVGAFLARNQPEARALLLPNGVSGFLDQQYDYTFEETLVNRGGGGGNFKNQYYVRDGSLTLPFLLPVSASDSWLTSVSVTADAPLDLPVVTLRGYFDVAAYPDERGPGRDALALPWTGGLRLSLPRDIVEVSFPLVNSALVREALPFQATDATYWDRVALRINLRVADVEELLREVRG